MVPFRPFFEGPLSENMYFIGGALLFTGCSPLFVSRRALRRGGWTRRKTARLSDALVLGKSAAGHRALPGVVFPPTAMTITTGCFVGFCAEIRRALFLHLSIPAISRREYP